MSAFDVLRSGAANGGRAMFVAVALMAAPSSDAVAASTHTVLMDGTRFVPEDVTVSRGDRVVWINKDPFPHTATAPGEFDSKSIAAGGSWSLTVTRTGEFAYVCTLHPGMKGVLVVK